MITSSSPSSPSSKSSSSSSSTYPYTPRASIPKYPYNPSSTYKPPYIPSSILPKSSTVPSSIKSIFDKLKNTLSKLRKTEEIEIEKNINYFLDKEIETPKELRNLSIDGIEGALLFINIGTFLFIGILFMSFFTNKNECCHDYDDDNAICVSRCCCAGCVCCPDGDCSFMLMRGGKNYAAALAQLFFILFFIFFKAVRACGKHTSRLIALIFLLLINITLTILSFISGRGTYNTLLAVFSLFCAICNLSGMILPNCSGCEKFSYDNISSFDYQMNEENSTPKQLLIIPPKKEIPPSEEALPHCEEVMQETIGKPVDPNCTETNPGYDGDNRYSVNSFDAAAPVYVEQDNDCNNQENDLYPKPQ